MSENIMAGGVAVITGAGSGIGEAIARIAASRGMKVVVADIAGDRAEAVAADIRAEGGEALAVATDVSDAAQLDRLAQRSYEAFGEVTLLVNNAGIEMLGYAWEIPAATWEKTLAINVLGVIQSVRAFAPRMIAAGKRAWIANVGSVGSLGMMPIQTSYMVSKHAVLSFSECLALEMELIGAPISVSCVLPGPVASRIFTDAVMGEEGELSGKHRSIMADMLSTHGLSPMQAGEIILDGIAAGDFWVPTHPDLADAMARSRADYLVNERRPRLRDEVRGLL
ncbi:SDR family NAD(P)-dependent oxidoreductase [Pseudomonas sp. SCB32]|uniref:SDR family NAD(P)-dependent oxidoreductase n=1 Tax=Pseudomonas sp. SCB32 TaxID=2653853 RepID=UPI0015B50D66|nr:SDR family NAD(P)-dependent oxidoreductase [Pseudomonas sp. SCB32]